MPRTMEPEESLIPRYPAVAEMWHPDRNGVWTPEHTTAGNSHRAWWRCSDGHEWDETVHAGPTGVASAGHQARITRSRQRVQGNTYGRVAWSSKSTAA